MVRESMDALCFCFWAFVMKTEWLTDLAGVEELVGALRAQEVRVRLVPQPEHAPHDLPVVEVDVGCGCGDVGMSACERESVAVG